MVKEKQGEIQGGDCGEREARRDTRMGTVVKEKQEEIQRGDCGEREARRDTRRGLW